jgi:uncharacterized phiE125 gp8 family phage protein
MTIEEMRDLTGLSGSATDAEVVDAYARLIDDGLPNSITLVEPVSVELARQQCRLEDDEEDVLIAQKITAAREWVEDYTGRIIAQQTLVAHFRSWGSYLEIPRRPVISVDAVVYNGDPDDASYTDGHFSLGPYPLRIVAGDGGFPALRRGGAIMVAYTAGYDAGEVPKVMIEAILVLVGGMMNEREGGYDKSRRAAEDMLVRLRVPVL